MWLERAEHERFVDRLPGIDHAEDYLAQWWTGAATHRMFSMELHELRHRLCLQFAFAIPCPEALDAIAAWGPIVEMGAGTGYWAHLLRKRGVDVIAYDRAPGTSKGNHFKFTHAWTEVTKGHPPVLRAHADRTLMLCWPDYDSGFASNCLRSYRGRRLIYIGEGTGGCTGDDRFHRTLDRDWTEVRTVRIPQWPSVHDMLCLYERGRPSPERMRGEDSE